MRRDRGFIDENNSSNESLDENVPLPVSKSTPIIRQKQKQKQKEKRKFQLFVDCSHLCFDLLFLYLRFSLLSLIHFSIYLMLLYFNPG